MVEAEASTGALPNYPPEPPVRKKEYIVLAEHEHWDYLKGSGPSAPPRVVRAPSVHPVHNGHRYRFWVWSACGEFIQALTGESRYNGVAVGTANGARREQKRLQAWMEVRASHGEDRSASTKLRDRGPSGASASHTPTVCLPSQPSSPTDQLGLSTTRAHCRRSALRNTCPTVDSI
jgi:hypothetical protein